MNIFLFFKCNESYNINSLGEPESMCLILDKFNFIIHSARHSYSETGNICPSFMTLGHFILFAKL